jgi:putative ABC transport system ATP-binding protein
MADERTGAEVLTTGVRKVFRAGGQEIVAVDGVSLRIAPGELVALAGPSGSGKSTLLHLLAAMERPDSGSVVVDGVDLGRLPPRRLAPYRRGVGVVFQRYNLLPAMTALDNVVAPVLPYKVGFDKQARARELLAAVGLAGRERSLPSRLSGGQQQRLAIARALVNRPRLLLADEPTGNLDSATGDEVLELILDLRREHGMTVVVATHDPAVASRCDRILKLRDGTVVDDLTLPPAGPGTPLEAIERLAPGTA